MHNLPEATATPHVRSAVNGIIVPLQPHQGGILHRFATPENRLVVARTSETSDTESAKLVVESEPDPALQSALQANADLQSLVQAQAAQLAKFQDQMAKFQEQMAAATAQEAPTARGRPRKVAVPVVAAPEAPEAVLLTPPTL